jgi:hypothetical protein
MDTSVPKQNECTGSVNHNTEMKQKTDKSDKLTANEEVRDEEAQRKQQNFYRQWEVATPVDRCRLISACVQVGDAYVKSSREGPCLSGPPVAAKLSPSVVRVTPLSTPTSRHPALPFHTPPSPSAIKVEAVSQECINFCNDLYLHMESLKFDEKLQFQGMRVLCGLGNKQTNEWIDFCTLLLIIVVTVFLFYFYYIMFYFNLTCALAPPICCNVMPPFP